jgi:ribonuclease HI
VIIFENFSFALFTPL